jgi:hypothetical protein
VDVFSHKNGNLLLQDATQLCFKVGAELWTNSIKKSDSIYKITITGFNFPPAKQKNKTTPSHFDKQIAI